jgi:hypothetical protein
LVKVGSGVIHQYTVTTCGYKASRDLIRSAFRGQLVEAIGENVCIADLDPYGRCRGVSTGCGELP